MWSFDWIKFNILLNRAQTIIHVLSCCEYNYGWVEGLSLSLFRLLDRPTGNNKPTENQKSWWMDEWMDGCMDGWGVGGRDTDMWAGEWSDGWMFGCMDGYFSPATCWKRAPAWRKAPNSSSTPYKIVEGLLQTLKKNPFHVQDEPTCQNGH